jgi:hypothetical protein
MEKKMNKLTLLLALMILAPTYILYGYNDEAVITEQPEIETSEIESTIEFTSPRESCERCPYRSRKMGITEIDCRACCSEGRWVNSECARSCGGCDMYNDEAAQEFRDYP